MVEEGRGTLSLFIRVASQLYPVWKVECPT